jgi:hypothetical protein
VLPCPRNSIRPTKLHPTRCSVHVLVGSRPGRLHDEQALDLCLSIGRCGVVCVDPIGRSAAHRMQLFGWPPTDQHCEGGAISALFRRRGYASPLWL